MFDGCTNLKNIEIPNSVEYIGSFSFANCGNLISIKLSDNLKYISRQCFQNCEKLKSVTIGCNTTRISYGSFGNCTSLQELVCNALEPPAVQTQSWSSYIPSFNGVNLNDVVLNVPSAAIELYKTQIPWNKFGIIREIGMYINVTLTSSGGGQINYNSDIIRNSTNNYEVNAKDGLQLTFVPDKGYSLKSLTINGFENVSDLVFSLDVLTEALDILAHFSINSYKLTYMIDDKIYKETMYEYGAAITPEPQPEGDYQFFEWVNLPQTMPAHDVVVYANHTSGIIGVPQATQHNIRFYSPNGKKLDKLHKGLNIVVFDDGTVHKIIK